MIKEISKEEADRLCKDVQLWWRGEEIQMGGGKTFLQKITEKVWPWPCPAVGTLNMGLK